MVQEIDKIYVIKFIITYLSGSIPAEASSSGERSTTKLRYGLVDEHAEIHKHEQQHG